VTRVILYIDTTNIDGLAAWLVSLSCWGGR
jgi:serine/threonine protein kinase